MEFLHSLLASILALDAQLFHLINQDWTNSAFDWFFPRITDLHRDPRLLCLLIPVLAFWIYKKRILAIKSILALGLTITLCDVVAYRGLKAIVHRLRPPDAGISIVLRTTRYHGFSFPSNHATNMFGLAVLITFLIPGTGRYAFPIAFLIAYSRPYVGVHYPGDVIAGALLGSLIGYLVWRLFRKTIAASRDEQLHLRIAAAQAEHTRALTVDMPGARDDDLLQNKIAVKDNGQGDSE